MRYVLCILWLATASLALPGCVGEEPAAVPTRAPVPPTVARPVLEIPSAVPSPSPSAVAGGQTYTVRDGDSLSSIAGQVYGDASEWRVIFEANRDQLNSPEALRVGMAIRIPPRPRPS
jgi:nucleoid-associated protein YgaU